MNITGYFLSRNHVNEGFSISIIKAMSLKLPIIATKECKLDDINNQSFIKLLSSTPEMLLLLG